MVGCTRCSMPGLGALGDAEQLDPEAELVGHLQVERRDRRNAFDMNRFGVDLRAEGEAGQDGELVGGVVALDIEGRVGLGIAETLGVLQAGLEGQPLQLHAREDVVAGAVEDAVEARDGVAGERLAQRLDDRDAAGRRGLEGERDAIGLGQLGQRHAVMGEQRLVGGDDRFAGRQRGLDRVPWPARPSRRSVRRGSRSPAIAASATGSSNQVSPARSTPRSRLRSRAETAVTRMARPQRAASAFSCRRRMRSTEAPTVPRPAMPMRRGVWAAAAVAIVMGAGSHEAASAGVNDRARPLARRAQSKRQTTSAASLRSLPSAKVRCMRSRLLPKAVVLIVRSASSVVAGPGRRVLDLRRPEPGLGRDDRDRRRGSRSASACSVPSGR